MSKLSVQKFFSYSWHIDTKETDVTAIRVYGLNQNNETVCVRINNFTPYIYVQLPDDYVWNESKAALVVNKIDSMMGDNRPIKKSFMHKYRLYYASLDQQRKRKRFPYLFLSFSTSQEIRWLMYKIKKPIFVTGLGRVYLRIHEHNASPVLQLTSFRKLPTAGWISFQGRSMDISERVTTCQEEYTVDWRKLSPFQQNTVVKPLILSFDIEVNSSIPSTFPDAGRPNDKVFQIACILHREDAESTAQKYLLTLGKPKSIRGVNIEIFETEFDLLLGFTKFIQTHNPNVVVGYNIFGFDIPYMIDRAKLTRVSDEFAQMGFVRGESAEE